MQVGVDRLEGYREADEEPQAADAAWDRYWQAGGSPNTVLETDAKLPGTSAQDISDRTIQNAESQWARAKSFDTLVKTAGSALKSINKDMQRFGGTVLDETHTSVTY